VLARTGEPAETTLVRFLTSRVRQAT
jgi:hypothetical protein